MFWYFEKSKDGRPLHLSWDFNFSYLFLVILIQKIAANLKCTLYYFNKSFVQRLFICLTMAVSYTACVLIFANTTTTKMFGYKQEAVFRVNKQGIPGVRVWYHWYALCRKRIVCIIKFRNLRSR